MNFKHGMRINCKIGTKLIKDARVSIDKGGRIFICQNKKQGAIADELFEYNYSWHIGYQGSSAESSGVTKIKILNFDYNSKIQFKKESI